MIIDITSKFHSLLSSQPQPFQPHPVPIETQLCLKQSLDIETNLSKISSLLQESRENYFSNAAYSYSAFTDQQRNQFDHEMKGLIDMVAIKIGELREVAEKIKFGSTTEKQHLKSMAICLYQTYKSVSGVFRDFIQFNENRKKKLQAMLGNKIKKDFSFPHRESSSAPSKTKLIRKVSNIDPQLQQQSKSIFEQKMSEHKNIEDTKKRLQQINQILGVMENKVLQQELLTSSFREIGEVGLFHIEKGNKNLVQANSLSKDAGKLWTMFFMSLAISLLVLDYLKS